MLCYYSLFLEGKFKSLLRIMSFYSDIEKDYEFLNFKTYIKEGVSNEVFSAYRK